MSIQTDLERLGLTKKEALVYIAGTELGPTSVQELSRKSGVKRGTIYEVISNLKQKELFSETLKGKKRVFVAEDPNIFKARQNDQIKTLEKVFPALRQLSSAAPSKPKMYYYDDLEEIKGVYSRIITEMTPGAEFLDLASMDAAVTLGANWINEYANKRKKKGITARTIVNEYEGIQDHIDVDKNVLREIRLFPKIEKNNIHIHVSILESSVFITSLSDTETMGIMIESLKIRDSMAMMFEIMWQGLPSTKDSR